MNNNELIADLCMEITNHKPISWEKDGTPIVARCVRTAASYCNWCPVKDVCTYEEKESG